MDEPPLCQEGEPRGSPSPFQPVVVPFYGENGDSPRTKGLKAIDGIGQDSGPYIRFMEEIAADEHEISLNRQGLPDDLSEAAEKIVIPLWDAAISPAQMEIRAVNECERLSHGFPSALSFSPDPCLSPMAILSAGSDNLNDDSIAPCGLLSNGKAGQIREDYSC
jgi:hypothetical protein